MSGRPRLSPGTWGNINVVELENGEYRANARYCSEEDETTRRISARGTSKAAAIRELKLKLQAESDRGSTIGEVNRYSTVAQVVNYWLEGLQFATDRLEESSIEAYKQVARTLVIPQLGHLQLQSLTPIVCDRWLKSHLSISNSRASRARNVLNQSLQMAYTFRAIRSNPLRELGRFPSAPIPAPRALKPDEIQLVRRAIREPERRKKKGGPVPDDRLICLVEILIATGCRIGEALALRRCDIFLDAEVPHIAIEGTLTRRAKGREVRSDKTKTPSSRRKIPISPFIAETISHRLDATKGSSEETLIFLTRTNSPWASSNVTRRLRVALDKAGLKDLHVHPHLFRKTVATEVDRLHGVRAASLILGHANSAVTEKHYLARSSVVDANVALTMMVYSESFGSPLMDEQINPETPPASESSPELEE